MKFIVFSDSHEYTNGMDQAIARHPEIRHIIHCGDMACDMEYLRQVYGTTHSICGVCGNNDFSAPEPYSHIVLCSGHKIYITHGHREHVKSSLYLLRQKTVENGCDICIFGHTHRPFFEEQDGLTILNPGSIGYFRREYAIVEVTENAVKVQLLHC